MTIKDHEAEISTYICLFVLYLIIFPIITSFFTKTWLIVVSPYIAMFITLILVIITKKIKKKKSRKQEEVSNEYWSKKKKDLIERTKKIYEKENKCPNCQTNLVLHSNHCEYCGWVKEEERNRYIPSKVKREVWRRDQGRCVECNSKERLEYDHIIPFSKGGSNTARNIQLLCERCNRKKLDSI